MVDQPVKAVPQTPEMSKNVPGAKDDKLQQEAKDTQKREEERHNREEEHRLKREKEREEVLAKAREILVEYHGQEANIPLTSEYWNLMNVQRGLRESVR